MKVLLVEDQPVLQASLQEALSAAGLQVAYVAPTSAEAVQWLARAEAEWDLAVIDIFLREGHGFEVLRACAQRGPERRAVVLSNYTREPARSSALALGADAVFDKSFEMEDFVSYCSGFAASRRPAQLQRPERAAA